jgi:hypothetical protein
VTILPPDACAAIRQVRLDLGSIVGRAERREDEDARGLEWRLATQRPTVESTARDLRAAAAALLVIADRIEPTG